MNFEEKYGAQIVMAFNKSPVTKIGRVFFEGYSVEINRIEFLDVYMRICEQWEALKVHDIVVILIIEDVQDGYGRISITDLLSSHIGDAIKTPNKSVKIECILGHGEMKKKASEFLSKRYDKSDVAALSYNVDNILFFCSKNGVDIYRRGLCAYEGMKCGTYESLINPGIPIDGYKELLKGFFEAHIKYDRTKRYFLRNVSHPTEWKNIIEDNPFILINKPEKIFQMDLVRYLRDKCSNPVLAETIDEDNDRYDVWVSDFEQKVYILEIKWIGKSIKPSGECTEYKVDKAINGAWQLFHYLQSAEARSVVNSKYNIHLGVLVVFDARDVETNIDYPEELLKKINLDLENCLRLEPKPFSASEAYMHYPAPLD